MILNCTNPVCTLKYEAKRTRKYCTHACSITHRRSLSYVRLECYNNSCSVIFEARKSQNRLYCSQTCSAKINNTIYQKRKLEGACKVCSTPISSSRVYCSSHRAVNYTSSNHIITAECIYSLCCNSFDTYRMYKKFCSRDCQTNNYKLSAIGSKSYLCLCGIKTSRKGAQCLDCFRDSEWSRKIKTWEDGLWSGGSSRTLSKIIRQHILEKYDFSCTVCGFNERHPSDNAPVVEIDHMDGDGSNHRPENLTVLCPNHHALTPTYRARNKGNGRKVYYLRVDKRVST